MRKSMKFLNRKSYYNKFLASLLLVLLVPILTIGLIFIQAQKSIREQIILSSRNTLNQFFHRVDDIAEESQEICLSLMRNSECQNYIAYLTAHSNKASFQSFKVQKEIAAHLGEKYYDIFIYYPSEDRLISGKNTPNTLDNYYDIYYSDRENDFREEFREVASCTSKKPVLCSMNGNSEDSYLCVSMRSNNQLRDAFSYVVVVVLNPTYVTGVFQEIYDLEQNSISMIFNGAKELIFGTGEGSVSYQLSEQYGTNGTLEDSIDGVKYVLQIKEFESLNAYYAYAVPCDYFWSKLYELYIICGVGTLATIILGISLVCREAKKMYDPIGQVINNFQQQGMVHYDAQSNTEFEFIEAFFEKELEEKLDLSKTIRKVSHVRKNSFIPEIFMALKNNQL